MIFRWVLAAAVGMMTAILGGCTSPGQRLLHAQIEKDAQLVLRTQFAVPDNWDTHAAWQQIDGQSFEALGELKPDPAAPQQITLKGKIRLVLVHAGKPFATADVAELRLAGDPGKAGNWRLSPGEMSRTEKAMK